MEYIKIGKSDLSSSRIVLGCMRISDMSSEELEDYLEFAVDQGVTLFDHADIYGGGKSEEVFGSVLQKRPDLREKIQIQSKCSIRPGSVTYYDLSKEHILDSVDKILERLRITYLDLLILHRPDALMEPTEIAEAFDILEKNGKVKHFGVSNFNRSQFEFLQKYIRQTLVVNQLQLSITNSHMIGAGLQANTDFESSASRDGGFIDYARLNDVTIQAWSPIQFGWFEGTFIDNDKFKELNIVLDRIAKEKNTNKTAVVAAWILRHPAKMQVIAGTTNKERLANICDATSIELSRKEWYEIYTSAGHMLP